jgi:hypothetical protein
MTGTIPRKTLGVACRRIFSEGGPDPKGFPLEVQDPSSVFLAFIGREDVAEDLGANRFDGDSVRSSRKQQGLLLVSRFVG